MERFQNILVGVDLDDSRRALTPGGQQAVRHACVLADKTGATLTFLHSEHDDSGERRHADLDSALAGMGDDLAARIAASEHLVTHERPWMDIIGQAIDRGVDLVIGAKRGDLGGEDGRNLGSNAIKLLRKCPCPVWLVHPHQPITLSRVLAATDLSDVGARATRFAVEVSGLYGAELHVVHAFQVSMELQLEHAVDDSRYHREVAELAERGREAILAGLAGEAGAENATLHVGCDAPNHGILNAIDHVQPDLLVMGTLSRHGIAGLLVGNTAEKLLPRIHCSMLTIKPEGFVSPVRPG